jgi:hypothetical protein
VAIVLVVIWALIKFGPYMDEVYKLADKESKLAELKKEIRQIQFEAMERVGAEAPGMIDKACAETFPKEDGKLLYRDIFNDYAKQSSEALVSLKTQSQEIISAYQDRYRNLTEIYYPAVKKNYVSLVDLRMAQAEKVERQIDLMIQNNFQWLFTRYQKAKSGAGPSLWNAQYDIWSATLSADAWFRTENGFSLTPGTPAQETPSQFGNSWNTIGPKMKRIFE